MTKMPMPDKELALDILRHKAMEELSLRNQQNTLALQERLTEASESLDNDEGISSEDVFKSIRNNQNSNEENFNKEHAQWLTKAKQNKVPFFKKDMVEYLWEKQGNMDAELRFNFWDLTHRVFELYQRLENKGINCQYNVIGEMRYIENPYSKEGSLPVFELNQDGNSIILIATDPIDDSYITLIKSKTLIPLQNWAANGYRKEFYEKIFAWLPEEINSEFNINPTPGRVFHTTIKDNYDLHGISCSLFKQNKESSHY